MSALSMYRRERARRVGVPLAAALLAALLVSYLVMTTSRAAFTAATDNAGNSVSTGTIELVDNDSGSALFNVTNMVPGGTSVNCIVVTYQGTVTNPAAVRLYSGGYTDSGTLGDHLKIKVEEGTGGTFNNCTGFVLGSVIEPTGALSAFDTTHTDYSTGAGVWDPSGTPESKTYRITLELDAATPDSQQGESITALTFTWEVQS